MRDDQSQWVSRVLGIEVGPDAGSPAVDVAAIWREAKDQVDAKLSALSAALRAMDDPELDRIASYGLFGLTDGNGVGLMRALLEFGGAGAERRPAAAGALRKAVAAYRAALDADETVALLDDNPFGVDVGLRATMGDALAQVERALG